MLLRRHKAQPHKEETKPVAAKKPAKKPVKKAVKKDVE